MEGESYKEIIISEIWLLVPILNDYSKCSKSLNTSLSVIK